MTALPAPTVLAAATRLRGQLVATPVIGGVHLGGDGGVDVRWKAELMQTGGSGWFRGYSHLLLKSYGALPGVSFCGPVAQVLAAAIAAHQHRLPMRVFAGVPLREDVLEALAELAVAVEVASDPMAAAAQLQRQNGYVPFPSAEHPEVAVGLSTIGLELGGCLPADCAAVYAPVAVCAAIAAGLQAVGRTMPVIGVDATTAAAKATAACRRSVERNHRLVLGESSAAVLCAALAHQGGVVGAVALD